MHLWFNFPHRVNWDRISVSLFATMSTCIAGAPWLERINLPKNSIILSHIVPRQTVQIVYFES